MNRVRPVYQGNYLQPLFRLFGRAFLVPPIVFFAIYWFVPALVLIVSKYLENPSSEGWWRVFKTLYLEDTVHILFAINLSAAAFFCYRFVRLLHFRTADILKNSPGTTVPRMIIEAFELRLRKFLAPAFVTAAFFGAAFCFWTLVQKINGPEYSGWWGHIDHGYAGYVYAVVMTLFVFFAIQYITALGFIVAFFRQFSAGEMRLRPLHRDGASGLGLFGSMMMSIWAQTILLSFALLIVVRSGYLDLVESYFVWGLGGAIVLVFPLAALLPLIQTIRRANQLKKQLIARLISQRYSQLKPCSVTSLEEVEGFLALRRDLGQISIFPLISVRFFAIAAFNALQASIAVFTLFGGV